MHPIELRTRCPFRGEASYWTIETHDGAYDGIAWSYEDPNASAEEIRRHLAFFADRGPRSAAAGAEFLATGGRRRWSPTASG